MAFGNCIYPPDPEEKKLIRKHYFRTAWIMIVLVLVFSEINTLVVNISAGMICGGFTEEQINAGRSVIRSIPVMSAIYSYGFPIAADIAALGIGILVTGTDLKAKLKSPALSGKGFLKATSITFSAATAASFVNIIIIFAIMAAMGKLSNFNAVNASSAAIAPKGNPLWLDILIYFYICLLGPVLEELIFRGVLLEGLRKYGNLFGIIMSALMFGLMHQNIVQFFPAFVIGIIWSYIAVKSGSLIPSILLHIMNNTMSALLLAVMPTINLNDISSMTSLLNMSIPFIIISGLISLFRFACVIGSIVIIVKYCSAPHGRLVDSNGYTSSRTWKYFFTSIPWLIVMVFLIVTTITSISRIA